MKHNISIILLLTIFLVSCTISEPSNDEIIGEWVEYQSTCDRRGREQCASIVFYVDGSFKAYNFPHNILGQPIIHSDANGDWTIKSSGEWIFKDYMISLDFNLNENLPHGYRGILYINIQGDLFQGVDLPLDLMLYKVDTD
jgi:hypothetical protein